MKLQSTRAPLGRRTLLAGTGSLLASSSIVGASVVHAPAVHAQGKNNGVALVIGNSKYHWEATLPNVKRDAPDVARTFQSYGLKTELIQDAGRDAMARAFDSFAKAAQGQNFAALYFAGHGASWDRMSYLVPVDSDLTNPNTVTSLFKVPDAVGAAKAANRLVVFDNCRNNPADGWRQLAAERNAAYSPEAARESGGGAANALVLFSTAPGRIARDGPPGDNSPFAAAFIRRFQEPSIDLQSTPSKLRRDLLIATQGRQILWDRNSYENPFVLSAPPGHKPVAVNSGNAGWAGDPSRIIELPKAYAWVREKGYPLPSGLVAHRSPGNSGDALKAGSYVYELLAGQLGPQPQLLIVMSVEEGQTAELITSGKGRYNPGTDQVEAGTYWRFTTARNVDNRIEYVPRQNASRVIFEWKDASGGSLTQLNETGFSKGGTYRTKFTRLD